MSWDYTGKRVETNYQGVTVVGEVVSSRVKYGGTVQHTVELDDPICLHGATRDCILVATEDVRIIDES